jgi:hypothetical protein
MALPTDERIELSRRQQLALLLTLFVLPPLLINAFVLLQPWTDPVELFRDPLAVAGSKFRQAVRASGGPDLYCCPYWLGVVSNVGILVWAATAGALFIALADSWLRSSLRSSASRFLLAAFLLTTLLAVDDVLQIHEQRNLIGGLKGEVFLFPLFGLLAGSYVLFRDFIRTSYLPVLILAVLCFGISISVDLFLTPGRTTILIEDSAKLFGIFLWAAYHLMIALEVVCRRKLFFQES